MAARNRRTLTVESLERRVVLTQPASLTLGVLGDSYSAEYGPNPTGRFGARNWVEILANTGRASIGSKSAPSPAGSPNPDYPFDKAVLGDTTTDVLQTQVPSLLPDVASGAVPYVCIFVGINDFSEIVKNFVENPEPSRSEQVREALSTAQDNLNQTVMSLLGANPQVKLVVATIPDVPSLPLMTQALAQPGGEALETELSAAVQAYNGHIRLLSQLYPSIALADVGFTFDSRLGFANSGSTSVSTATFGVDINDTFQIDGLHPNTIPQGWIANDFLGALRTRFHVKTSLIPSRQISQFARLAQWRQSHGTPLP